MSEELQKLGAYIKSAYPDIVNDVVISLDELTLLAKAEGNSALFTFLVNDSKCQFVSIIDICGVDYPEREHRFDVVYHLLSPQLNHRIRIKVQTDEDTPIPSLIDIYPGADWFEREAYDMFGILFSGHPDLRRILTDYGFEGHPLRKDFPTSGYVEVRYDETQRRVIYEPVKLTQEYRQFDFLSPWEGTDYVLPGDEKKKP